MIKALLLVCMVAYATSSPAYYGYSGPAARHPSHGPKYSPPPKEDYIAHRPSYQAPSYAPRPAHAPAHAPAYAPAHAPSYAPSYAPAPYSAPKHQYAEPHYSKPSPYNFGYEIDDGYGTQTHQQEEGDDYGNKKGSYGYTDAYGLYRKVDYVADDYGFRAAISTNEPGTANASPASVNLYSSAAPAPAPYKPEASYSPKPYAPAPYKPEASYSAKPYAPAPYKAPARYNHYPEPSYEPSYPQAPAPYGPSYRQAYVPKSGYGIYGPSYGGGYSKQYFNMGYAKKYESPRY